MSDTVREPGVQLHLPLLNGRVPSYLLAQDEVPCIRMCTWHRAPHASAVVGAPCQWSVSEVVVSRDGVEAGPR